VVLLGQDRWPKLPGKKHISGVGMPLIAVVKIKKNISWHISCYFLMFCGIFSITTISCSLVIRWAYLHYVLAVEVKNFAKITFLSFNTTAVFLHDVMVQENDVLEAR